MFPKHNFVATVFLVCCFGALSGHGTATYCSLDRMKKFAMEACEHLFEALEVRSRRSLDHGHMANNANAESADLYHVRRSIYPQGGYLKVGPDHYRNLSRLNVSPPYKAKKIWQLHHEEKKMRFKRNDEGYSNYISYCCFRNCDEDFFC